MCEWKPDFEALRDQIDSVAKKIKDINLEKLRDNVDLLETRLQKVEIAVAGGFSQINNAITSLADAFGERMNTMDARLVDEKAEWGKAFRKWLDLVIKLLITGCATAMGVYSYCALRGH